MENCTTCKWRKILDKLDRDLSKTSGKDHERLSQERKALLVHCDECVAEFREKWDGVCTQCLWKDRNLPYEARKRHCAACAEEYAKHHAFSCGSEGGCQWDNPKRRMPSDAAMAHCKACIATRKTSKAMNCESCDNSSLPESVRRVACIGCSLKFQTNPMVIGASNELSNKGQTIESYDNHAPGMTDDRDTVQIISSEYKDSLKPSLEHPLDALARVTSKDTETVAKRIYDRMKGFLRDLADLPDLHALVALSMLRGEKQRDFARNHNISDSAVHNIIVKLMAKHPTITDFMKMSYSYDEIAAKLTKADEIGKQEEVKQKTARSSRKKFVRVEQMQFDFGG